MMHKYKYHYVQGGGESITQLFERCKSALLRIGKKYKGISYHKYNMTYICIF
jgi:broad specificity phosphatase PhoE